MSVEKIVWVVNYGKVQDFLATALAAKATGVAIRTDNDIAAALPLFADKGIKVFGWRWPSALRDPAMREADKAATLLGKGMDGYFVDPEGEPGKPWNWDQAGLGGLADEFCSHVRSGSAGKILGVTSHYRAKAVFPKLPWAQFFAHADVLLPQSYWRTPQGTIGHGLPADNYKRGLDFWSQAGGARSKIQPMSGELASITASEIALYAAEAAHQQIRTMHFYTAEASVKPAVWNAIAAA